MELRGHIIPPAPTYSPAGAPAGRLQELRERQRGLRQALGLRLRELRRLCLQEAELTGKLPPEYPLEPGERPQPPPRRRAGGPPRGPLPEAARAARREVAVQLQVVEAARRLAAAPGLPPEQRRRRQRLQAEAAQRLRQLRAQLGAAAHDENGSLCDLPALENGALPGLPPPAKPPPGGTSRPSPPRAASDSPDRRPPWAPDPAVGGAGRRSSLASPASPVRTLPRSASSFEGRSVPATPVLARSPCARGPPLCRVAMETTAHPYWPRSLALPGYVASARPGWQCAGAVAAAGAGLVALGWALGGGGARGGASRSPAHRLALGWFLMCTGIHGILEGYFSLRHRELPADTGLLADVWKEYAKADSRYMTSDDFTVAMETVTAWAWGPLSFLTFLALLRHHPTRYVLQLLVSLGQLYGDVLYFATEARAGWSHSDPRPLYFWGYFVGLNGVWVLVPVALLADACRHLTAAQRAIDRPRHKAH